MYGIRDGYQHRETPDYFYDVQSDGKLWQPDVLPIAAHLARKAGRKTLIDIGCGRGEKLIPYAREFEIVGIDYGANIEYCRENHDFGEWVNWDIEADYIPYLQTNSVMICADVIEHLRNPTWLVTTLSGQISTGIPAIILTTPDRERVYGYDQNGPPGNVHHVREWTLRELRGYLGTFGLEANWAGWTLNNNIDRELSTCMLIFGNVDVNGLDALFTLERTA